MRLIVNIGSEIFIYADMVAVIFQFLMFASLESTSL